MVFATEPLRLMLASSSTPALLAVSVFEMMARTQPSPSLPPEPPDPLDLSSASSPSHSASKTSHHRLLTPITFLDLTDTKSRSSDCSRRLMLLSPDCISLCLRSRDPASHLHSRRMMCPSSSPSPSPRSHVDFYGPSNHSLVGQDLDSSKDVYLSLDPSVPPSFLARNQL
ncbi:unnamed protein product [Arabis nemorensis]|uniref:Uncharacterized protein n=1 Tax=Arabis nemorensis TaxID=586526 RepID=A0A565BJC7_9BRAS|nr:unnamed protein product [Arabis nemorensis]